MTDLEQYIEDIKRILATKVQSGENPIVPTQDQLDELAKAETRSEAIGLVNDFGWQFANETWQLDNPSEDVNTDFSAEDLRNIMWNQGPSFIGVESYQPITYKGEVTEIGRVTGNNFYLDGDQNFHFEGLMPDKIMELQADFINAGLLGPAVGIAFRPGVWQRDVEGKIMARLMGDANASGLGKAETGWENKLQIYLDNPVSMPSQPDPYLPPDYAAISSSINNLFEQELGRKPQPYELKLLADSYDSDTVKEYNQEIKLKGQEKATPENLATYGNHIQEMIVDEGLTEISPSARLVETFDRITEQEKERLGVNADIQATNRTILNSITSAPW